MDTREELEEYDHEMAKLLRETLGDNPWRYRKPMAREPEGRAHLAGFDPEKAPAFRWRAPPAPESPESANNAESRESANNAEGTESAESQRPRGQPERTEARPLDRGPPRGP